MTGLAPCVDIKENKKIKGKNIFTFSPSDYQEQFSKNGYILIKNGIDANFLEAAIEQAEQQRIDQKEINNCFFKGKKRQYLYGFEEWDFYDSGLETLARTASLPLDKATLCERHIKVYEPDAKPHVPAHKDRIAAQVTVGIPLLIPEGSHIVLWPEDHLDINALNTTALWRNNLDEEQLPQNILDGIEPVRIYAEPGGTVSPRT